VADLRIAGGAGRVTRETARRRISDALEGRRLIYFGTRGEDAEAIADLPELVASFGIIARHKKRSSITGVSLEQLTGVRVDLDAHDIDEDPHAEGIDELRRMLLRTLSRPTALFTYRPSTFVSAVTFARKDKCRYIGMFKDHQAAFEHKPWVETQVAALGIAHIPWTYVSDEEQLDTLRFLEEGPAMLRRSRTSGGVGLARLDEPGQLQRLWPEQDEAYVSVAPYIDAAMPINVAAVVWENDVTLHPASLQLIGVPSLTGRPFGYCGNDFGAIGDLERERVDEIEVAVRRIGRWLGTHGYRGAFGVDFLIDQRGVPLFTEVNARFQGSTHASCQISLEEGESCVMLDHLAALLGLEAPGSRPLWEQARNIGRFAHFVVHAPNPDPERLDVGSLVDTLHRETATSRIDIVARPDVVTHPGAAIARVTVRDRLTRTGFDLADPWDGLVRSAPARAVPQADMGGSGR
jgi:hypothetical protein